MNKGLVWRGVLILAAVALSLISLIPLKEKIKLGLDLRGGMHLTLKVNTDDALRSEVDKDMERLRQELVSGGVSAPQLRRASDTTFEVTGVAGDRDPLVA